MIRRLIVFVLLGAALVAAPFVVPAVPDAEPIVPRLPAGSLHEVMRGIHSARSAVEEHDYRAFAAIVPHHLTATDGIAAGTQALAGQTWSRIVLLSPDHFGRCPTLLCVTASPFESLLGPVPADPDTVHGLAGSPLVTVTDEPFADEHGIGGLLPYVAHFLPGVRVVPVLLSQRLAWRDSAEEMADLLVEAIGPDGALLVSSDFSHYLPLAASDAKDEETVRALLAFDLPGIARLENPAQSDCPGCLWLLSQTALRAGAPNPSVLRHTNSARLLGDESAPETTSHFAVAYYRNRELSSSDLAVGGDVTVTRGWPPALPSELAAFWAGPGPRIVNLEGPLATSCEPSPHPYRFCNSFAKWKEIADLATHWGIANNHAWDLGPDGPAQTAGLLHDAGETPLAGVDEVGGWRVVSFTATMNPVEGAAKPSDSYDRLLQIVRSGSGGLPTIVYIHAGTEGQALPSPSDAALLRSFVDAGADAVLAVHSHVPGDVEIHRGKPIFRGLGNFLFDQEAEAATSTTKVVRLRMEEDGVQFETAIAR